MSKLTNLLFMITGIFLVFYAFGILDSGITSIILDLLLNPESMKGALVPTLAAITAAAGALLLLSQYRPDLTIFAPISIIVASYGWDLIIIFNNISQVNGVLAIMIISPLLFIYVLTCVEWWRGITT